MAFAEESYKSGYFGFPSLFTDPEEKKEPWYRRNCEALYSLYVKDMTSIQASRVADFITYRAYAKGMQDVTKYMDIILPKDKQKNERSGHMNISWDILPLLPKYRSAVLGKFQQIEYDVMATAVDELSMDTKTESKWMAWAKKEMEIEQITQMVGSDKNQSMQDQVVKTMSSVDELNMYAEIGGFKMVEEVAMEKAIDLTFTLSDWPEIKNKVFEDLFDLGIAATMDYFDPIEQKVKVKYLDPECLIVRYSKEKNFSNIDRWGYLDGITIAELRRLAPEFTEEDLQKIAAQNKGYNGNLSIYQTGLIQKDGYSYYEYDNFSIQIMYSEWDGINTKTFSKKKDKFGNDKIHEASNGYMPSNPDTKVLKTEINTIHKCWWVVGTKYVYDWGIKNDIPRDGLAVACKSLRAYKLADRSMVANAIPLLDAIQLNWLKFQNDIAMSAPSGLAIDIDAVGNVVVDGVTLNPLEVLDIRRQSGDLLFSRINQIGNINPGGTPVNPVSPITGGVGAIMMERINTMRFYVEQLEEITGINKMAAASTPDPNQAVGVAKLAVAATGNVLQPLYQSYVYIKQSVAKNAMLRIQYLATLGRLGSYSPALSSGDIATLKIGADVSTRKFGIKMEMRPTDEMKHAIRQSIAQMALKPIEQGGLSAADQLMVEYLVENSTVKIAMFFLAFKEKQNKAQAAQQAQQAGQMQDQQQQAKIQGEQQAYQAKVQADAQAQIAIDNNASLNKQKEITLQGEYVIKNTITEISGNSAHVAAKLNVQKEMSDNKISADLEKHHTGNMKDILMEQHAINSQPGAEAPQGIVPPDAPPAPQQSAPTPAPAEMPQQ